MIGLSLPTRFPSACSGVRPKYITAPATPGAKEELNLGIGRPAWKVVGGDDETRGIIVQAAQDTRSSSFFKRLVTGSRVAQLERQGNRLHYTMVEGVGPDEGWVSITFKGKDLLVRE